MKLRIGLSVLTAVSLLFGGCATGGPDYHVIYEVTCPAGPSAEMRYRLQSLSNGIADRLQMPRQTISSVERVTFSKLQWHLTEPHNTNAQDGVIIITHDTYQGADETNLAIEIKTIPNEENANVRRVRSAVEAELTRVGCGKWDFRHHVKLS